MAAQDWVREYDELQRLCDSAQNNISKMHQAESQGDRDTVMQQKQQARTKLKQVGSRLPELKAQLQIASQEKSLMEGEIQRRVQNLKNLATNYNNTRDKLNKKYSERTDVGFGRRNPVETYDTMNLSNQEIKQMHQQKIDDQDKDLDDILQGTKRLREIGYDINVEIDRHGRLLEDIEDEMDKADNKVNTNIKRVSYLEKKTRDRGCCLLMAVLLIAIVVLIIY